MLYADYPFYVVEYLRGKEAVIDTASFDFYIRKASQEIKRYTFENIRDEVPECVKMCCCELAEKLCTADKNVEHSGKASESVGAWSVSYESAEQTKQALKKDIKAIVYSWLSGTGLLFAGVKKC